MNFEAARTKMVDNQIRTTDVTSHSVLSAFLSVPREEFVPAKMKELAYIDTDISLEVTNGNAPRFLMEPSPLAKLLQLAEIAKSDVVLEIGCGTGYASALLSQVAGSVVALESDEGLAATATETLSRLGYDNIAVVTGELEKGYAAEAPYDVIFVHGSVEVLPTALFEQLRDGGRLVVVEGFGNASRAKLYVHEHGKTSERPDFNTAVKPLPGFRRAQEFVF
ncbi:MULTISPECIES: protein-L-isoaspartate O-methyltransferase [Ensifer]|jgi:protein-L-isoaspartate(D-aspartate) O-methyltransferase|uniref:Protein-L-isoaspartate O-methyltransferase n=1 Tax=Ensifer adhaerens TaxID=106592 RepID=A0ABY8HIS8_ENSAD|nr:MULTISPECIES: protein-L-isoaspartate O-methyltransferase [Ensifer]ANK72291.1 protein-L-isoaspartate O-methyltransferase [Ensifer adhaerens]KDP74107.1 protein-L-isoaspartate O-methyltransferase [Ensifer adhaerens]KQX21052.1 protein-L-isoaspartate O-methyltransferase [Ensifer sp. Root423]KQZ41709.1 protein-L-isoaspartate O-methyltransferase [Ensifer sp. Root558]MBD9542661.1 protein-L-isoaspartate O-methyltransferase [Ensifer sp. ENS04]